MTKKQMVEYIKNINKDRDQLAMSNRPDKDVQFDLPLDSTRKKKSLSIPNLFDHHYHRQTDQEAQNLQKAAERLKEKNRDSQRNTDNRISGASTIDDLRRDPSLLASAGEFLRDAGLRAPWLQTPAERDGFHDARSNVRGRDEPGQEESWDRHCRGDRREGDRDWRSRDAVLLNRNRR